MSSRTENPAWEKWKGELPDLDLLNGDGGKDKAKDYLIKILSMFEAAKDFTDAIPDAGPIPLGSLVKAVIQLMSTGKRVLVAKAELHTFISKLVLWIRDILKAFSAQPAKYGETAWSRFEPVRRLVEEIFEWARERSVI